MPKAITKINPYQIFQFAINLVNSSALILAQDVTVQEGRSGESSATGINLVKTEQARWIAVNGLWAFVDAIVAGIESRD